MQPLILLLAVTLLAIVAHHLFNGGAAPGLSFAVAYHFEGAKQTFFAPYEKFSRWFDKSLEDLEKSVNEGFTGLKGTVENFKKEQKDALDKKASAEDVEAIKKEYKTKFEQLETGYEELVKEAGRLKDAEKNKSEGRKSLRQQLVEGVEVMKADLQKNEYTKKHLTDVGGAHGDTVGLLKSLHKGEVIRPKSVELDVAKAATDITTATALTGANINLMRAFEVEPGVAKSPYTPFYLQDLITVTAVGAHTIFWTELTGREGSAGQVAEAAAFPQISLTFEKKSANSKKTAAYAKFTNEMLEDVDYFYAEINDELVNGPVSVREKLENQLFKGDGIGENHLGIFQQATAFVMPTGFQTLAAPNRFDAIQAICLACIINNYTPTHVLVNPTELVNMILTKDTTGQYLLPTFVTANGLMIGGVQVVANNRVAPNEFLCGDMRRARLNINRSLTVQLFDQDAQDAITDMRTVTASLRGALRIKTPDKKAFVKGTFSAVQLAIKTP